MAESKPKGTGWNLENSYSDLPELFFTKQNPTRVKKPTLVKLNLKLAEQLGLDPQALQSDDGVAVLCGNRLAEGSQPIAQAYAGHQFGYFTMLGDGRALLLGEQINPEGKRYDIQLKGSGKTPYSRGGDGKAALGPMLREYIISEAMHALGIQTTRSLAVVTTGEPVYRETVLPGAILTRVASSHIRVGTFQFAAQYGSIDDLRQLADYTLQRHFAECQGAESPYLCLLNETIKRQAALVAKWQLVGFIHGVMNTDNMLICGETIDYGPCAFMDSYDPETVFSSIDREGRYAYGNQPYMAAWNLARFAEALLPLLDPDSDKALEKAQKAVSNFADWFQKSWLDGMRAKLGLLTEEEDDLALIKELLELMHQHKADFTNTFVALTFDKLDSTGLFTTPEFQQWHTRWKARRERQPGQQGRSAKLMRESNPAIIPRNHRVEEALEAAAEGDYSVMERLLEALSAPYAHTPKQAEYAQPPGPQACRYQTFCGT